MMIRFATMIETANHFKVAKQWNLIPAEPEEASSQNEFKLK